MPGECILSDISSSQSPEGCFLAQDMEFSVYVSQAFEKTTNSSSQPTHMKWCELCKVTELLLSLTVVLLLSFPVASDSLQPHGLQHTRLPCPSQTPGAYSNSCLSHWWCHPAISSSVVPFSSHLQSFPASGSFPISCFFASGGQSIGVSASASVLPMNIQDWFPLGLTGLISFQSKEFSRVFSNTTVRKFQFFDPQLSL